jgi:hypothetical protein
MKFLSLLACLVIITGCATTETIDKPVPMIPPSELVSSPMPLVEIVASSDGTVDLKGALSTAISNNNAARQNAIQLQRLEDWLKDTEENIKKGNGKR